MLSSTKRFIFPLRRQRRGLSLSINITCSKALNEYSLKNPEAFWSETSKSVTWFKPYEKVSNKKERKKVRKVRKENNRNNIKKI